MLVKGSGFGIVGDIIVGIIGAFIGGFVLSALGVGGSVGIVGSIIVAIIGAVVLLVILHLVTGGTRRSSTY
jgi:uncharacterized membrane protein YeaQ/YmgE (transglycosylase-associated protein family)